MDQQTETVQRVNRNVAMTTTIGALSGLSEELREAVSVFAR